MSLFCRDLIILTVSRLSERDFTTGIFHFSFLVSSLTFPALAFL